MVYNCDCVLPGDHLHGWLSTHKGIAPLHQHAFLKNWRSLIHGVGLASKETEAAAHWACQSDRCASCKTGVHPVVNSGIALAYIRFGPRKVLGRLYMSKEAAHRLGAIDNAFKEEGGRLSVILRN